MTHKPPLSATHPAIIIDIEASGCGTGSNPIEIGVAFPDGNTQCYLIKPENNWLHWSKKAEAVHGIKQETLIEYDSDARTVAQRLNSLLRGKTVYSNGGSKDVSWLATLFEAVENIPLSRIETLTKILSPMQMDRWRIIKANVIRNLGLTRHRASVNTPILQRTYQRSLNPLGATE